MKIEMTLLLKYKKIIIKEIYEKKKFSQKRKALYSSIYIPKTNVILLDENNSAILIQKKKMTVFYIAQDQVYHLIHYLF